MAKRMRCYAAKLAREKVLAEQIRQQLLKQLGSCCAICGEDKTRRLEFDHPAGRDWEVEKYNRYNRMLRYQKEAAEGKLRILCRRCNAKDKSRQMQMSLALKPGNIEEPF